MSHDPEDRCFYCMSEAEFHRASVGKERRTIFMDSPLSECPNVDPADFEPESPLDAVTPPAAVEGGTHPEGSGVTPRAVETQGASQSGEELIDAETERRWRRALLLIRREGCIFTTVCRENPDRRRVDWCPACVADHALDPTPSSPETPAPGGEAARPEPSAGDHDGSGRASNP